MAPKSQTDLTEFLTLSKPKKATCPVGLILTGNAVPLLKDEEIEQLEAALSTDVGIITGAAIQGWLKARGHETNPQRISNHRRRTCTCD